MDRYVRSLWAAVVGSWFIPPLAGRTGVYSRWFFHVGARRRSRRGNLGQTASQPGRFFGKPQNDTNGVILAAAGSGFSIGSRMTLIKTWTLETGRWTLTLLPSPSIRKTAVIGLAALLVATTLVPILNFIQPNEAQAAWYNEDWMFRKGITVTHESDESNVYTTVELDTSDTTRFKSDCSDLRFTDYNGTTIPYHVVSGCGTASTEIELLFGSLPAGEQTLYAYYGNASASDTRVLDSFNNEAAGVTTSFGSEESSAGPIAEWKFDEGYGTTAHASSWSGAIGSLDGTINGATWQSEEMCPSGKCLFFHGVNDYVEMGSSENLKGLSKIALSAWIKPDAIKSGHILGRELSYKLDLDAQGHIRLLLNNGGWSSFVSSGTLSQNIWHLVVGVYDGSNVRLYIDGKLDPQTHLVGGAIVDNTRKFTVGSYDAGGSYSTTFLGSIDDPKVYSYARTQQQIQQDYIAGITSLNQQQANLSNGLVGYWKMDESSWNGTAGEVQDASGNGNNGQSINGAAVGGGKFGNGGSFDGVDDYMRVDYSNSLNLQAGFTVSLWLYNRKPPGTNYHKTILYHETYQTSGFRADIKANNTVMLSTIQSGGNIELTTPEILDVNRWYYLTFEYSSHNSTASLYIDGVKSATQSGTYIPNLSSIFQFGTAASDARFNLDATLDETRIYNRALSSTEVQQLYNYAPKPVAYYDFEEGAGNSVYDKSGNGNMGTWSGTGVRYAAGQVGKAGSFNETGATNDWVDLGSNIVVRRSGTLGAWVRVDDENESVGLTEEIVGNSQGFRLTYSYDKPTNEWKWGAFVGNSLWTPGYRYINSPGMTRHQWVYVSAVRDFEAQKLTLYVNGVSVGEVTNVPSDVLPQFDWHIGKRDLSTKFKGLIDEVKIYNYARTPGQIVQDMQAGRPVVDSPIGYWKFDEGQGIAAHDSSGMGNDGTLSCQGDGCILPEWLDGKQSGALFFDAANTNNNPTVTVANTNLHAMGDVTVAAWIKPSSNYTDTLGSIVRMGQYSDMEYSLTYNHTYHYAQFSWYDGAFKTITSGGNTVLEDEWSYVVAVRRGTTVHLYINGRMVRSGTITLPTVESATSFSIGRSNTVGVPQDFSGHIDELKVYNQALTSQDILVDYNQSVGSIMGNTSTESATSGTGQTATKPSNSAGSEYCVPGDAASCAKPVAEWDFEDGSGFTVKDTSGNGNNGTWSGTGNAFAAGKAGKAGNFNGVDTSVSYASSIPFGTGDFTIGAWFKMDGEGGVGVNQLFTQRTNVIGVGKQSVTLGVMSDKRVMFQIRDNEGDLVPLKPSAVLEYGNWYYVSAVKTSSNTYVYLNGQLIGTNNHSLTGNFSSETDIRLIGKDRYSFGDRAFFNGQIDQMRIYNYARTPAQVAWDYNYGKPIAQYKFDECSGSVAHNSSSWSGAIGSGDGTINLGSSGVTTVGNCENASSAWGMAKSGKYNSAMSFDGVDDEVRASSSLFDLTDNFSISAWIKPQVDSNENYTIVGSSQYAVSGRDWYFHRRRSGLGNQLAFGMIDRQITSNLAILPNIWTYVLFVLNNGRAELYLNGRLDAVSAAFGAITSGNTGIVIGNRGNALNMMRGQIDDVQIFNYALTDTQVKALYNGGAVRWGK